MSPKTAVLLRTAFNAGKFARGVSDEMTPASEETLRVTHISVAPSAYAERMTLAVRPE